MRPRRSHCVTCGAEIVERRGRRFCLACSNRKSSERRFRARRAAGSSHRSVQVMGARERLRAFLLADEPSTLAAIAELLGAAA